MSDKTRHFVIHRYPGRINGIPTTLIGWGIFTTYLIGTTGLLAFLALTLFPVMQRPILFFLFMTLGTLAIIGGIIWIMFRMGEVVDHR